MRASIKAVTLEIEIRGHLRSRVDGPLDCVCTVRGAGGGAGHRGEAESESMPVGGDARA